MENNDILLKIQSSYNQFTKIEQKIADFILKNTKQVLYLSISDLAVACGVGDTSVFRFCKKLKLRGYQDFRLALSLSIHDSVERAEDSDGNNEDEEESFKKRGQKIVQNHANALKETMSLIDEDEFDRIMYYFEKAENVYFFGIGSSMLTAMFAMSKFLRITTKVHCVIDSGMQTMLASMMTKECLAVVVSYSGFTKESIKFAKLAKSTGAKVVCITRYEQSALTNFADAVLLCAVDEKGPLLGGSTSSLMSRLFIVELMYLEYYRRQKVQIEE